MCEPGDSATPSRRHAPRASTKRYFALRFFAAGRRFFAAAFFFALARARRTAMPPATAAPAAAAPIAARAPHFFTRRLFPARFASFFSVLRTLIFFMSLPG